MNDVYIAFDCDGTLIRNGMLTINDELHFEVAHVLMLLHTISRNVKIVVWSGGGQKYAEQFVRRYHLEQYVWRTAHKLDKTLPKMDIAFDDEENFNLAKVNIITHFAWPKDYKDGKKAAATTS